MRGSSSDSDYNDSYSYGSYTNQDEFHDHDWNDDEFHDHDWNDVKCGCIVSDPTQIDNQSNQTSDLSSMKLKDVDVFTNDVGYR